MNDQEAMNSVVTGLLSQQRQHNKHLFIALIISIVINIAIVIAFLIYESQWEYAVEGHSTETTVTQEQCENGESRQFASGPQRSQRPEQRSPPAPKEAVRNAVQVAEGTCDMKTEHLITRQRIKDIPELKTFEGLLESSTLSDTDKQIMRLHYLKEQDFRCIGDSIGLSESSVKSRHRRILKKLARLF